MNNIIKRVWNQNKMVNIEALQGMTFQAESGGHTFQISGVDDTGAAVPLSGTVAGVFMRPDRADIALVGSASDGVVSVTLTDDCYAVPGRFGLTIFVTSGGQKTAVYAAVGTVSVTSGGGVAGETPQDVVDLINAIAAAVATIPADYTELCDDVGDLKIQTSKGGAVSVVPQGTPNTTYHGVTYTCDKYGNLNMVGTSDGTSFYNFYSNENEFPDGIEAGGVYLWEFDSQNTNITFRVYAYFGGDWNSLFWGRGKGLVKIPIDATGIILRVGVTTGQTVNETVSPKLWNYSPNFELEDKIETQTETNSTFSSWAKGTLNADGTISTSNNGAVSSKESFYKDTTVFIWQSARCICAFFDRVGEYLGKVGSDGTINKTSGTWKYFDTSFKPSDYAPATATSFLICNMPTDGTTIDASNLVLWANSHAEFVNYISDAVIDNTEKIDSFNVAPVPFELRNGSVNNTANAYGVTQMEVIPCDNVNFFRIHIDDSLLASGDHYRVQLSSYTVSHGKTGINATSNYRIQIDQDYELAPGQTDYDFYILDIANIKSVAFAVYHLTSSNEFVPIRIENIDKDNFIKVTAFLNKPNNYYLDSGMHREKVTISTACSLKYVQSFCVYDNHYFSTDGSNIGKQTRDGTQVSLTPLSVGHGNAFQLGSSNLAYISGWDDNTVYVVDLDTITISDTITLPVTGYTTVSVDDINELMYIFHRTTYPNTETYYNFVVYDYANNQIVSQKKITKKFGAMQACEFANGKIYVAYGTGTETLPTGLDVYNTSGDIIGTYSLDYFSSTELEGVCFDRSSNTLLISDAGGRVFALM